VTHHTTHIAHSTQHTTHKAQDTPRMQCVRCALCVLRMCIAVCRYCFGVWGLRVSKHLSGQSPVLNVTVSGPSLWRTFTIKHPNLMARGPRAQAPMVAVRSSGVAEDGAAASFAGLFESLLNVPLESVSLCAALQKCLESADAGRVHTCV
jgi:hypothetical protein